MSFVARWPIREALCAALNLGVHPADRQWQAAGLIVRCPRHGGVSCSVTRGNDGTVRVRCFGCDFTGDALHLVAEVHGLDVRRHFVEVLRTSAEVAHRWDLLRELASDGRSSLRRRYVADRKRPTIGKPLSFSYPPDQEVLALWNACVPCADDREACAVLERRAIWPDVVDQLGLARALPRGTPTPTWARFRGERARSSPWTDSGHRLLLPVYDKDGRMRSLRAWCVRECDDPKRLPPAGYCARGLVLACPSGASILAGGDRNGAPPPLVVIVEGEPDFLTWATRSSDAAEDPPAVLGVTSRSWGDAFAARIPDGSRVVLRTHHDVVGNGYARAISDSLAGRCTVLRSRGCDGNV